MDYRKAKQDGKCEGIIYRKRHENNSIEFVSEKVSDWVGEVG